METVKIDFEKMQAAYFLQYGYKFDETALAMLLILEREQRKMFAEQNAKLNTAIEKIRMSQKSLQVDTEQPHWQAFLHGMGKSGFALLVAVIFAGTFYAVNDLRKQEAMPVKLKWYENFYRANIRGQETKAVQAYLKNNPMPK